MKKYKINKSVSYKIVESKTKTLVSTGLRVSHEKKLLVRLTTVTFKLVTKNDSVVFDEEISKKPFSLSLEM